MHYFFSTNIFNNTIILSKEESRHCIGALRHKEGDCIHIVDGLGNLFECEIISIHKDTVESKIINKSSKQLNQNFYIHIAIAPTKSSQRTEWFVEKAVEIGINEISFIKCLNSERTKINIDRINKIAVTAMKQTLKSNLPKINEVDDFTNMVKNVKESFKFIGYLGDVKGEYLGRLASKNSSYCLLIGPEGDFTQDEFDKAVKNGFRSVSLGDSRLRTETAGIAGCLILNGVNYE